VPSLILQGLLGKNINLKVTNIFKYIWTSLYVVMLYLYNKFLKGYSM